MGIKMDIKKQHPKGLCCICGKPKSDMRIDLQVNIFRGDDVVYKVHSKCIENKNQIEIYFLITDREKS